MSLDFDKCFDRLSHQAIKESLKYFNFGDSFIKLKQNPNIRGIDVYGVMTLISQFADDTVLFLEFSKISLEAVINTLSLIERNTGLLISYDKTLIYRIGSLAGSDAKVYTSKSICWTNEPFTILGITVHNDVETITKTNFDAVLQKMETVLDCWYTRNFTLMGKTLIINTLAESLFVYKMQVLPNMSTKQHDQVDGLIKKYLWRSGNKINLNTLKANRHRGGLRLFDSQKKEASLKIKWLQTITHNGFFKACFLANSKINSLETLLKANLHSKDLHQWYSHENPFWYHTCKHWCEARFFKPKNQADIMTQRIWLNSHIKASNKTLFYHEAY